MYTATSLMKILKGLDGWPTERDREQCLRSVEQLLIETGRHTHAGEYRVTYMRQEENPPYFRDNWYNKRAVGQITAYITNSGWAHLSIETYEPRIIEDDRGAKQVEWYLDEIDHIEGGYDCQSALEVLFPKLIDDDTGEWYQGPVFTDRNTINGEPHEMTAKMLHRWFGLHAVMREEY